MKNFLLEFKRMEIKTKIDSLEESIINYFSYKKKITKQDFYELMMYSVSNSDEVPGLTVKDGLLLKEKLGMPEKYNIFWDDFSEFFRMDFNVHEQMLYVWVDYDWFSLSVEKNQKLLEKFVQEKNPYLYEEYKLKTIFDSEKNETVLIDFFIESFFEFKMELFENKEFIAFNQRLKDILENEYDERCGVQLIESH